MNSPATISELYGEPWTARRLIDGEPDGEVRRSDQTVRPGTTAETLAGLKPVFGKENGRTGGRLPATIVTEMERRDVELGPVTLVQRV